MGVTLDSNTLQLINLFERETRARVKDCIPVEGEDRIIFVVEKGHLRQALGKKGDNVRNLREKLKKVIDVIEYSPNPERFVRNIFHNFKVLEIRKMFLTNLSGFVRNIFHNFKVLEIRIDNGASGLTAFVKVEAKDKGRAIGKEGKNLKLARKVLLRHHQNVTNIMIL